MPHILGSECEQLNISIVFCTHLESRKHYSAEVPATTFSIVLLLHEPPSKLLHCCGYVDEEIEQVCSAIMAWPLEK